MLKFALDGKLNMKHHQHQHIHPCKLFHIVSKHLNILTPYSVQGFDTHSFTTVGYKAGCFLECLFEIMVKSVIWFLF